MRWPEGLSGSGSQKEEEGGGEMLRDRQREMGRYQEKEREWERDSERRRVEERPREEQRVRCRERKRNVACPCLYRWLSTVLTPHCTVNAYRKTTHSGTQHFPSSCKHCFGLIKRTIKAKAISGVSFRVFPCLEQRHPPTGSRPTQSFRKW